jgi:hypothetical protein
MQLARYFSSAAQEQSRGLAVVSCPLRARLGALGFGSPADLLSDHLVSQLRIPLLRGTRLRRAVGPGDLCRPSGPYDEGQARGQARWARGEPR